jgi:pSer/pThr/pTyr-binding forkhead associated (FHA) protein
MQQRALVAPHGATHPAPRPRAPRTVKTAELHADRPHALSCIQGIEVKPAELLIQPADGPMRIHPISSAETLIGRSMHSDVKLTDTGISREHATITWEGESFLLEDLQSTNGTKVNDKRIRSVKLRSQDRIQIGRTVLTFRLLK